MNMIDTAMIRENYANMQDGQLIAIANQDGHVLTPEAFQILREEFKKRNLDYSHIESAEQTKIQIHEDKIQKIKESVADDFLKEIWKYIFDEKEKGASNEIILKGLQERGVDEPHSSQMLTNFPAKVKEIIGRSDTKMIGGGLSFIIGIFVTLGTYSQAMTSGGTYIVAWGAVVFGAIGFFSGSAEKSKYKRLLNKIEEQENAQSDLA